MSEGSKWARRWILTKSPHCDGIQAVKLNKETEIYLVKIHISALHVNGALYFNADWIKSYLLKIGLKWLHTFCKYNSLSKQSSSGPSIQSTFSVKTGLQNIYKRHLQWIVHTVNNKGGMKDIKANWLISTRF